MLACNKQKAFNLQWKPKYKAIFPEKENKHASLNNTLQSKECLWNSSIYIWFKCNSVVLKNEQALL